MTLKFTLGALILSVILISICLCFFYYEKKSLITKNDVALKFIIAQIITLMIIPLALFWYMDKGKNLHKIDKSNNDAKTIAIKLVNREELVDQDINTLYIALRNRVFKKPNDAFGWYLLSRLNFLKNNLREAISTSKMAFEIDKKNAVYAIQYAMLMSESNNTEMLIKSNDVLLAVDEKDIDSTHKLKLKYQTLSKNFILLKKYSLAQTYLKKIYNFDFLTVYEREDIRNKIELLNTLKNT